MIINTRNNLALTNPLLEKDEIAYEIDRDLFKIGDGRQNYNSIDYNIPSEEFKNTVHFLFQAKKLLVPGEKGNDGLDGKDGEDGKDGIDGKDGVDGKDGLDGDNGEDGKDGKNGEDGRDGINGDDGEDGKDGKDGKDGRDGLDGKDGQDGKDGISIKGDNGEDGKDGSLWLTGGTEPSESLGKDGDMYINISNGNYYQKISGKWKLLATLSPTHYFGGGGGGGGSSPSGGAVTSVNLLVGAVPLTGTANRITISAANLFDIGTDVVTLTGAQALSNKTGLISQWTNDSGYATATSATAFTNKTGNISQWTNDSGYITAAALSPYLPLAGGTLTGNLLFSADNTHDIGAAGATRPRRIYVGTEVVSPLFTGALAGNATTATTATSATTATTATNLAGGTLGAIPYQSGVSTTSMLAATATAGQMLRSGASAAPTWSTNTWENATGVGQILHATAANVIAGSSTFVRLTTGELILGGTGMVFGEQLSVQKNQNAATYLIVSNTTSGAGASASFRAYNNISAAGLFGIYSTTATPYGIIGAGDAFFYANGSNLSILADAASAVIKFAAGGSTEQMRLTATGKLSVGTQVLTGMLLTANGAAETTFTTNPASLYLATSNAFAANMGGGILFGGIYTGSSTTALAYIGGLKENATDGNYGGALVFGTRTNGSGATTMEKMRLTSVGNFKIAGTATRATTEGTNHLDIFDGTAPVGTLANGISLYSTAGELRVMDAAGNATLLSPHEKKTNYWIYDSVDTTTGKRLKIDMELFMKWLNNKFKTDFVHEYQKENN